MFDVIIIGAGFAGYTAAIYAARYDLKTLVIGSELGGMIIESAKVCNYPGYSEISGLDLMNKFYEHAKGLGAEIEMDEVLSVSRQEGKFVVKTRQEKTHESKALILALGTKRRKLHIPGVETFEGKGIHYCATCDAAFYKNKLVAVIGGANSAAHSAALLSRYAKKVYLIYRGSELKCEPIMCDLMKSTPNIEIIYDTNLSEIKGSKFVEKVALDKPHGSSSELDVDGIFVEIGGVPSSALAKQLGITTTEQGEIIIDQYCETSVPGVFSAGDVTNTVLRQGVVASAQGAIAATSAYRFITGKKKSVSW